MAKHKNPRRLITAEPAAFEAWDRVAEMAQKPWSKWARDLLDAETARVLRRLKNRPGDTRKAT